MTRKQNSGRRNDGMNVGGGSRSNNGGRQINNSGYNDQSWSHWSKSGGGGGRSNNGGGGRSNNGGGGRSNSGGGGRSNRGGGGRSNRGGRGSSSGGGGRSNSGAGGGCGSITKFTKFADDDNRNREPKDWGPWGYNHHYDNNGATARGFGGTSNLYDKEERNENNNDFTETLPEIQDGIVAGNNQQVSHFYMENKTQTPPLAEPAPMPLLNNEIQNTNIKDSLPNDNGANAACVQQEIPAVQKPKLLINIKQEKSEIKLKRERKSSSSSSSNTSSSADEEPEKLKKNRSSVAVTTTNVNPVTSPLAIKIKPPTAAASNSTNTTSSTNSLSITMPKKPPAATTSSSSASSSSSSSETEEEQQHPPPPIPPQKEIKNRKNKKVDDGDVVCLGLLENKIVLEDDDEDDNNDKIVKSPKSQIKGKKSEKKSADKCMICDKKGHTSFQCQMICKNCSAPYHGFRTCPHPANLNTMLQTFMEFSMQQLQNFQPDKQFTNFFSTNEATATRETADSQSSRAISKARKRKTQLKAKDTGRNLVTAKKRKVSTKKKQANSDEDDSDSTTQSEESSSVSEDGSSSEGFESLNTSKNKKSKAKSKSYTAMPGFNMPSFMPNTSINYPLSLNGISNIATASTNPQLNTLLLNQMFHNAIGSLANPKRS